MRTKMYKTLALLLTFNFSLLTAFGQSPEKVSYQAVVRDASDNLVSNTQVGMQISILQSTASGTAVYVETHTPTTNANGLVSIEIGGGTVVTGDFTAIDWAGDTYFIKTETDPAGGTAYSITGTSQLLSVPYALYAKTAETVTGGITETDPVYNASEAANITADDITNLGNLSGVNTGDQDLSGIAVNTQAIQDTASQIRADIPDVSGFVTTETDPVYNASEAANITAGDLTNLGNLSGTNTGDQDLSGIAANTQAIQDTASQIRADIPDFTGWDTNASDDFSGNYNDLTNQPTIPTNNNELTNGAGYLTTETDPSVPSGTAAGQMQYWNGTAWITVDAGTNGQRLTFINGAPVWIDNDAQVTASGQVYKEVTSTTGKIWMDRNLGASQVATSSTDAAAYGDMYQWGRDADGHQIRTSGITSTLATSDTPGHSNFIINSSTPHDWRSPKNNNLWQDVNGTNNPCPSGYRLPTETEWNAERTSWSSNNAAGAFASPLKLPMAGSRNKSLGSLNVVGLIGFYWSSSVGDVFARSLFFLSSAAGMGSYGRATGLSVRCLKD